MRTARFLVSVLAVSFCFLASVLAQGSHPAKKITVIGKLTRVLAIGAETTGWSIEPKREITLEGKKMKSIEISGSTEEFEKLNDQRVRARGVLTHHTGIERPDHLVLEVSSIRAVK